MEQVIKKELQQAGLRGIIHLRLVKVDLSLVSFDDEHINKESGHNVTFEEAKGFIKNAVYSMTVWDGHFERYYSYGGTAYVNKNNLQIRTSFKSEEYDPKTKRVMEVMKKHGR